MARPRPDILHSITVDDCHWDITAAERHYVITYQGRPCGVRQHVQSMAGPAFKYQKLSYTGAGSAQAQVRRLNKKFMTTDFAYIEVG